MAWQKQLRGDSLSWLLEPDSPGVRYLAMRDLLKSPKSELAAARKAAHRSGPIAVVLSKMEEEGYWSEPGAGYNPKYFSTVWSIILLAQLGARIEEDRRIAKAVADGATTALTLSGDTVLNLNRFQIGFGVDSTPSVLIQGTSRINKTGPGWLSIGNSNNSNATVTVRDSGSLVTEGGDFNVGDTATSKGTLLVQNNGVVTSPGAVYIGKNGTTGIVTAVPLTSNGTRQPCSNRVALACEGWNGPWTTVLSVPLSPRKTTFVLASTDGPRAANRRPISVSTACTIAR